jgi:hypothetical protein
LKDHYGEDLVFLEPEAFDAAIIGVSWDGRVTYDAMECVELFMQQAEDDDRELAHKHFDGLAKTCQSEHRKGAPAFVWMAWEHIQSTVEDSDEPESEE